MTGPLVSVLIPAHNAEATIAETIRSVLLQSWRNLEVIVVDDGSTDRTLEIARRYQGPHVRIIGQPQAGAARARNHALTFARGDFIQWLDADDLLSRTKIEVQLLQATGPEVLLSCKWGHFYHCPDRAVFTPTKLWASQKPRDWLVHKLLSHLHMQPATWLVSRELTEAAGPWDETLTYDDDGEYFARVICAAARIHFCREATVYYRLTGGGSLSRQQSPTAQDSRFRAMTMQMDALRALATGEDINAACLEYMAHYSGHVTEQHREAFQAYAKPLSQYGFAPRSPLRIPYRLLGSTLGSATQALVPAVTNGLKRHRDRLRYRLRPRVEVF